MLSVHTFWHAMHGGKSEESASAKKLVSSSSKIQNKSAIRVCCVAVHGVILFSKDGRTFDLRVQAVDLSVHCFRSEIWRGFSTWEICVLSCLFNCRRSISTALDFEVSKLLHIVRRLGSRHTQNCRG